MAFNPPLCGPKLEEDPHPPLCWPNYVLAASNNIFIMILECLLEFGGLRLEELRKKLVNMGCDGSSVLQAIELVSRCANQRKGSFILSGVHCFAQKIHFLVATY